MGAFDGWDDFWGAQGRGLTDLLEQMGLSKADQNRLLYDLQGVPVIGDIIKASENHQSANEYLRNHGMTWEDVTNVLNLPGGGSLGAVFNIARQGTNFVSDNVKHLYE